MNHPFGPWATPIDVAGSPRLDAFWRRRMKMLVPVSRTNPRLSLRNQVALVLTAVLLAALPTIHAGTEEAAAAPTASIGRPELRWLHAAHKGNVECAAFSPDGKTIVSGGDDGEVCVWDAATGKSLTTCVIPKLGSGDDVEKMYVHALAWSPDGKTVAVGCTGTRAGGTVRLMDIATGKVTAKLTGRAQPNRPGIGVIRSIAFTSDGKTIIVSCSDNLIRFWDVVTGKTVDTLTPHPNDRSYHIALSADRKLLAVGGREGNLILWDIATRRKVRQWTASDGGNPIFSLAFSPDGKVLATGCNMLGGRLWNVADGKNLADFIPDDIDHVLPTDRNDTTYSVAFSRDGKTFAHGCDNGLVRLLDVATGKKLAAFPAHTALVRALAFSPDGETLVSASNDGTVKLWEIAK